MTATTLMNFRAYPMDTQVFRMDMLSCKYNVLFWPLLLDDIDLSSISYDGPKAYKVEAFVKLRITEQFS